MQRKLLNAADCPLSWLEFCLQEAKNDKDEKRIKRMKEIIEYNYPKRETK